MRKSFARPSCSCFAWLIAGLFVLAALSSVARADGSSRRRKPPAPRQASSPVSSPANATDNLPELVRRAEQAAEAAQTEARRAREQTEVLQQQLLQVTKELAALRQSLAESAPRAAASANLPMTSLADARSADSPTNPQSADRLSALEEQVEINTAQIKEHAQTKVEAEGR
ncbi:MAG TPA: hypothetical protein PKD31_19780, partial [Blastocatellia bacterium]|nr:hypothetical protein [Blastocatellia bacterium]